ncbi:hypothetical protein [Histidinibacterium aquaticum]|uniref:Uncharacterized protein n=1 Tax=Histidinibacterium aquaticum TaxID=2613962 RepID=A0A5J5GRH1_9RHOB|nr:hypothetical protein [Histidinibacterium aquaticum]KAA9010158.1 hypothetical protein F3S47_02590 [Histidinibacterium aquaticum]
MHYKAHTVKAAVETLTDLRERLASAESEVEGLRRLAETMPNGVNGKSFADSLPKAEADRDKAAANVADAAADLVKVEARTMQDVLRKVAALLAGDPPEGAFEALTSEAKRILEQDDPVIELAQRQMRIRDFLNSTPNMEESGWMPEDPRVGDAIDALIKLEREIEKTPPRTPEGLAMMLDVKWRETLDVTPGTDIWASIMDDPETRFLATLRYGAHTLAGRKRDFEKLD